MKTERNRELLEQFLSSKEDKILLLPIVCELFNPNNPQVTNEYLSALMNNGSKDEHLENNEFLICGGKKLKINPNELPPSGTFEGVDFVGVKDLKKLMGVE